MDGDLLDFGWVVVVVVRLVVSRECGWWLREGGFFLDGEKKADAGEAKKGEGWVSIY